MAMAKPSLAEGVRRVTALPPLNAPGTAAAGSSSAEEAWAALSQGLRQCRKSPEVLDRFSEPERLAVLKFLVLWPKTRKTLRGQATQYHQTLKTSALWAETARSEEFQRFLHVELSEDQVEVLNSPPKVVTTLPESLPRRISVPADVAETSLAHLRASLAVMERYGFLFPNEFHSTGLDQGTQAFELLHKVATAISKLDEKEHVAEAILGQLDVPWEDVLKFLISMYESGVRKVLDARLKFVVNTFRSSSRFRQATETLDLPWEADALGAEGGYSPEPAEPYVDASSEPVPSGEDVLNLLSPMLMHLLSQFLVEKMKVCERTSSLRGTCRAKTSNEKLCLVQPFAGFSPSSRASLSV